MSARIDLTPGVLDRIKANMVGLRMPRALEIVDSIIHQLERGEVSALEAIDTILAEELTLRETRRIKTSLAMARLSTIKTLAGCSGWMNAVLPHFPCCRSSFWGGVST